MGTKQSKQQPVNDRSWNKRRWDYENGIAKQKLSSTKTAFLLFISRKTLGFQKVNDHISLSQIQEAVGRSRWTLRRVAAECHEDRYIIYEPGCGLKHLSCYTVQEDKSLWTKTRRITPQFEEFLSKRREAKGRTRSAPLKGEDVCTVKGEDVGAERGVPVVPHNTLTIPLTIEKKDQDASLQGMGLVAPPSVTQDTHFGRDDKDQPDPSGLDPTGSGLNELNKPKSNESVEHKQIADQIPSSPRCEAPPSPRDAQEGDRTPQGEPRITEPQLRSLRVKIKALGHDPEEFIMQLTKKPLEALSKVEASRVFITIQALIKEATA